jgi:hypothetical protein
MHINLNHWDIVTKQVDIQRDFRTTTLIPLMQFQ